MSMESGAAHVYLDADTIRTIAVNATLTTIHHKDLAVARHSSRTDPAHPFFGQKLPTVFRRRAGRRDHVLVKLPGGGRRAVPIAATSLADHISALDDRTAPSPSLVSVRTLLPVARLVRALTRRGTEVPNAPGHRSTPTDTLDASEADPATTGVDGSPTRTPAARRSRNGRARPPGSPAASA